MCVVFCAFCMVALAVSPGSFGSVLRTKFVPHGVPVCVPGDLHVIQRVFCVLQSVKTLALPP